jgi:pteridine reductase
MSNLQVSFPSGFTVLITGAARRIGASIATALHNAGANIAIHYRSSEVEAGILADSLNSLRADSARCFPSDLLVDDAPSALVAAVVQWAKRLDVLVNNASSFYATPIGSITYEQWDDLVGSNLKAPLFLAQAARPHLSSSRGCIVNIIDIHAQRPLRDHAVYGSAKAGLAMLTRSMAKDLAPEIRVNGISPGAILWPENGMDAETKEQITRQIPLARQGLPRDVAAGVLFLVRDAPYVTGQIVAIDGGRSIGW